MSKSEVVRKKGYEQPVMKGGVLVELRGKFVSQTIKDISHEGIRLEVNNQAQAAGKYEAGHMETTNILQRIDGSADWDTKAVETTPQGDFIVYTGKGSGGASGPNSMKWEGEVEFMSMSPKFSWLNGKKGWIEGSGNIATGEVQAKIYERK